MELKKYCPECGHEFKQGESDFNYETAATVYTCPECGWQGTAPLDADAIKEDLEERLGEGRTVTKNDIENVVRTTAYGEEYDEAVKIVAREIEKSIEDGTRGKGDEEEDEEDDEENETPQEVMVIEARRTDYSIDQVLSNRNCMTIGELKLKLEMYDCDDPTPIVFSHDNGYTYGPLQESCIDFRELE